MDRSLSKYEKKTALVKYYCDHLHDWAIEHHDEKIAQKEYEEQLLLERKNKIEMEQNELKRLQKVKKEMQIIEDDYKITQAILPIIRKVGLVNAVNVGDRVSVMKRVANKIDSAIVELRLKPNIDFTNWRKNGRKKNNINDAMKIIEETETDDLDENALTNFQSGDNFQPFNLDLTMNSMKVMVLQCYSIGERGVMFLASDFIRGACSYLEVLSLAHCYIQSRGLSKLLHGLRIAKLRSIISLDLRGNCITPRGLEYLKESFQYNIFDNLISLDLRENELGDEGATSITRMITVGCFINIQELYLQYNNITDKGFSCIAKILRHLYDVKCPHLDRLGLEGNKISPKMKKQFEPLPAFYSL